MMNHWNDLLDPIGPSVAHVSWHGTVLAGLVVLTLIIARNQLAPRWRFVLWGLVVARFLLPAVPESRFSLFDAWNGATRTLTTDRSSMERIASPDANPPRESVSVGMPPVKMELAREQEHPVAVSRTAVRSEVLSERGAAGAEEPVRAAVVASRRWTSWQRAALVWLIGALFFAGRIGWQFVRLRRQSCNWHESRDTALREILVECQNRLAIRRRVQVLVGPDDCGPAVTGLLHPVVVLPERFLTDLAPDELRFVLLHELSHLRRHDIALQWLALIARALHWFNPAAWFVVGRMASEREMACDEAVLDAVGPENRQRYSETLIRLAREAHATQLAPGFIATFGSRDSLRRRLEAIDLYHRRGTWSAGVALGLIGGACLVGLTDARSATNDAIPPDLNRYEVLSAMPATPPEPAIAAETTDKDVDKGLSPPETITPIAQAVGSDKSRTDAAASGLAEGWKKTVTIPATTDGDRVYAREGRLTAWVEMGWLLVRRSTAQDDLEWQVVLARASDPTEPALKVDPVSKQVEVSYRGFFAGETSQGKYRMFRERKSQESPEWPSLDLKGDVELDSASAGLAIGSRLVDGWRFLQIGHSAAHPEIWLRFQPMEWYRRLLLRDSPFPGVFSLVPIGDHATEIFAQDNRIADRNSLRVDDDLFVGFRVTPVQATLGLDREFLRKRLASDDAPQIVADEWLNTPATLSLEALRGKVVLLAFGAVDSPFSARHRGQLQSLQQRLADRGLSVIGIYPEAGKERLAPRLKDERVTFPIAIDVQRTSKVFGRSYSGETASRYDANALPLYFLVDRRGKLAWGIGLEPPPDHEIEPLLRLNQPAPALDAKQWHNAEQNLSLDKLRGKVVLLTFWIAKRGINPKTKLRELEALRTKYAHRDLAVIGVYAPGDNNDDVGAILKSNGITFPVMIDAGETEKRYFQFIGPYFGSGAPPKYALIDKAGNLVVDLGPLPGETQIDELLK